MFDRTEFCLTLWVVAIRWAPSADKHQVAREDALHAMLNHYLYVAAFDEPRVEGASRPDLYIAPRVSSAGTSSR